MPKCAWCEGKEPTEIVSDEHGTSHFHVRCLKLAKMWMQDQPPPKAFHEWLWRMEFEVDR